MATLVGKKHKRSGPRKVRQVENSDSLNPFQWKKGQSGNVHGRPPGVKSIAAILKELMSDSASLIPFAAVIAEELGLEPVKTPIGAVLAAQMVKQALDGDTQMLKEILNRVDGKVADVVMQNLSSYTNLSDQELEEVLQIGRQKRE